jgi:glycosyltransferase involved in cell wall biosynthesis
MYNKRIAFLMSYQHLIPHGGIGQFALSFVRLMKVNNIKVDIVTDKFDKPTEFTKTLINEGARFIYADNPLPYTKHQGIFMYGDSYCLERMINFRNSMLKAFESNIYDAIVCNTYETSRLMSEIGLEDCVQIINYTHLESQIFVDSKNPFLSNVNETMRLQMLLRSVAVGTQSNFNTQILGAKLNIPVFELPIPMPEPSLLETHIKDRTGVLFIGRWEEGKGPEDFLKIIEATKLPAKVMTNANGAKKFEARLKDIGVPYEIKESIIGQEKVNFITSARVAFNPSTVESYGIAFLEQHIQLPTVAYEGMRWLNNFNSDYFYVAKNVSTAINLIQQLYEEFPTAQSYYDKGSLEFYNKRENNIGNLWVQCFDSFKGKQSNSNTAGILNHTTISYADYITSLKRNTLCIDDIRSVLTNKHKFITMYTDTDTWLTTDENFVPPETVSTAQAAGLFEGL